MAIEDERTRIVVFGTNEPSPVPIRLEAGPLAVEVINGAVRGVRWQGVEVIRGIDCPIRDENWATYSAQAAEESVDAGKDSFNLERRYSITPALSCRVVFTGQANGFFRVSAELTAHSDFPTNRAGLILLHPLEGVAGSPVTVLGADGSATVAQFPLRIDPRQPVLEIAGLVYSVQGIEVKIAFTGETFEMEDQRNWTDASFKTYGRPLSRPRPYVIPAGETVCQQIEIQLTGVGARPSEAVNGIAASGLELSSGGESFPVIALALDSESVPDAEESGLASVIRPPSLQLRVHPETVDKVLSGAEALMSNNPGIDLEIVIPKDRQIDECLEEIARKCARVSIRPAHVVALPEAFLRSYSPDGSWPDGPTLNEAADAARRWFPKARIGGGVLTNFTEANRLPPTMLDCDFLTHGTTAIVHTADDRSVVESLEGLSHVFSSARVLAGSRDYRLGLVSIGMRSNPYGPDVLANPNQIRMPMARVDPRQRGLFAAAWAVGAMAATEHHGVSSIALAALVGPFGIVYRRAEWSQPIYDDRADLAVYPLFHVFGALSQMAAAPRLTLRGVPTGVAGVAAEAGTAISLLLANLSGGSRDVTLPQSASVRLLNEDTFDDAIGDPGWLNSCKATRLSHIALRPFNVAFVSLVRRNGC